LAGEFSRFLFLFLAAVRKRIIVLTHVVFKLNRNILVFLRSSFFQITGTLAMALNPIVNRIMASWLGSGTISLLEYSERIYQIPVGLFLYGFLAVLLSHWSDGFYSQDKDIREFRKRVIGIVRATAAVGLLSALALFLFRAPIVQLLYGYGRIPERHLPVIADLLAIYLIGLAPFVIGLVFTRAFMVLKHMRVFLIFGVVNFASNIVLNLFLIGPLGIYAFAASTTLISFMVAFGLHFYLVRYELSYEHAC